MAYRPHPVTEGSSKIEKFLIGPKKTGRFLLYSRSPFQRTQLGSNLAAPHRSANIASFTPARQQNPASFLVSISLISHDYAFHHFWGAEGIYEQPQGTPPPSARH